MSPSDPSDADALARALELELKLKRATWAQMRAQRHGWRMLSLAFLLLVFLGALCAWFFFAPQLHDRAAEKPTRERVR